MAQKIQNSELMQGTMLHVLSDDQIEALADAVYSRCVERYEKRAAERAEAAEAKPLNYWLGKLSVSRSTVWRWERDGKIKPRIVFGKKYYTAQDFAGLRG